MAKNRKPAETFILEYIEKIMPGSENTQIYKDMFATMTDEQFEEFITNIKEGKSNLAITAPNNHKFSLNLDRNFKIADELGHNFFQRIWIHSDGQRPTYLTPVPYMVVKLPLRRQAQLLVKKISIPEDNKSVDDLTGQPTGKSKGSKISYPEAQVLAALGLDSSLNELMKYRGGDLKGFDAMNRLIARNGEVQLDALEPYASGVESTKTLKTILTAMHLKSTL